MFNHVGPSISCSSISLYEEDLKYNYMYLYKYILINIYFLCCLGLINSRVVLYALILAYLGFLARPKLLVIRLWIFSIALVDAINTYLKLNNNSEPLLQYAAPVVDCFVYPACLWPSVSPPTPCKNNISLYSCRHFIASCGSTYYSIIMLFLMVYLYLNYTLLILYST